MTALLEEHPDLLQLAQSHEQLEFATEAVAFLASHASRRAPEVHEWGHGPENLAIFHETSGEEERAEVEAAKAWQATKWAAGFGWITGPLEHGGRGLSATFDRLYREIEAAFQVADFSPIRIGLSTVGPSLVVNGTDEQVRRFAVPIQRGEIVACQLFSEPEAGSDLAGARTRAERDGNEWRLTGQKVWTSNAQFADIGLALARTDDGASKHAGLSVFVVPMDAAGVEVRPLRQLTGGASFCEVFLDEVTISDDLRVGAVGDGWAVVVSTLAQERASTGDRSHGLTARALALLVALADRQGLRDDAIQRQRLADVAIRLRVAAYHQLRMQAIPTERQQGPERALDKLVLSDNLRRVGDVAAGLLGPRLVADTGEWGTAAWSSWILGAPGYRIAGGTDEILRTMIGERLLGLPREPKMHP
jgi:alkylation response protein AidB-like acyl-CoA dehydrogenase